MKLKRKPKREWLELPASASAIYGAYLIYKPAGFLVAAAALFNLSIGTK